MNTKFLGKQASQLIFVTLLLISSARADVHLLGSPQVRRELKISHATSLQILHNLNLVARANSGGFMNREQAQKQRALRARVDDKAVYQQTLALLSPSQKQRLQELAWQSIGNHIWSSQEARQRLKLTAAQHQELLQIDEREGERYARGIEALMESNRDWYGVVDRKRYATQYAAHDRQFQRLGERKSRILSAAVQRIFTPQQKVIWKTMLSQPFDMRHLRYDTESYPMN